MIERCRTPRCGCVTLRAVLAEIAGNMIRISCVVEICLMTTDARPRRTLIHIVDVALIACRRLMRAGQREVRVGMTERRRLPHRCVVARRALVSEAWKYMPRICRLIILRLMTWIAVCVLQLIIAVHMALLALCCCMTTREWEVRC